jgi:hypothetical protein
MRHGFRNGFILHSGLRIEREIPPTFEIRNFPQQNIPVAKSPPLVITLPAAEGFGKGSAYNYVIYFFLLSVSIVCLLQK